MRWILCLLVMTGPVAAQLQPLGFIGEGKRTVATAASADGNIVVGDASEVANGLGNGFRWTPTQGMQSLGPAPGGYYNAGPRASSADGAVLCGLASNLNTGLPEVAVWQGSWQSLGKPASMSTAVCRLLSSDGSSIVGIATSSSGAWMAFRAPAGGGFQTLDVPGGFRQPTPDDITPTGAVIVGQVRAETDGFERAARWDGTAITLLDTPPGDFSLARAVSADGLVIVGQIGRLDDQGFVVAEAAVWTPQGRVDLGGETYQALFVSDDGQVVGGVARLANSTSRFFRWTAETGVEVLPLPDGFESATLKGMSADGSVLVGEARVAGREPHAYAWTLEAGAFDLGTLGTFLTVTGLSADGSRLFGYFSNEAAQTVAFVGTVAAKTLRITGLPADTLVIPGSQLLITYEAKGMERISIALTLDRTPPASPNLPTTLLEVAPDRAAATGFFLWTVPDTLLTAHARLVLLDLSGETPRLAYSHRFRIRPLVLARLRADSTYQVFDPAKHSFAFSNREAALFPPAWRAQPAFQYSRGADPFVPGSSYPFWLSLPPVHAAPEDFADWPSYVRAFGRASAYEGNDLRFGSAWRWSGLTSASFGGACFGMAHAALMLFADPARFAAAFPDVGLLPDDVATAVPDLDARPALRAAINQLFARQYGQAALDHDTAGRTRTVAQTVRALEAQFRSDDLASYGVLSFYELDGTADSGGHTVVPTELRRLAQPGRFNLFIYDNNHPLEGSMRIVLDTLAGRWTYDDPSIDADDGRWTGTNLFFLERPHVALYDLATVPPTARTAAPLLVTATPGATFALTNAQGQTVAYDAGRLTETLPGAAVLLPKVGGTSEPVGYQVPMEAYTATLAASGEAQATFFAPGTPTYGYRRTDATPAQTDALGFDATAGLRLRNPDDAAKTVDLYALAETPTDERLFALEALRLSPADSTALRLDGAERLVVRAPATATTYTLRLVQRLGGRAFEAFDVALAGGTTHTLRPDWETLATVTLDIDTDGDGVPDETRTLANQVAAEPLPPGAVDGEVLGVWPNPLHGPATVSFRLTQPGPVRLALYDLLGREVRRLVDREQPAGAQHVVLDGSDLAAGVYILRLVHPGGTVTRRLTRTR